MANVEINATNVERYLKTGQIQPSEVVLLPKKSICIARDLSTLPTPPLKEDTQNIRHTNILVGECLPEILQKISFYGIRSRWDPQLDGAPNEMHSDQPISKLFSVPFSGSLGLPVDQDEAIRQMDRGGLRCDQFKRLVDLYLSWSEKISKGKTPKFELSYKHGGVNERTIVEITVENFTLFKRIIDSFYEKELSLNVFTREIAKPQFDSFSMNGEVILSQAEKIIFECQREKIVKEEGVKVEIEELPNEINQTNNPTSKTDHTEKIEHKEKEKDTKKKVSRDKNQISRLPFSKNSVVHAAEEILWPDENMRESIKKAKKRVPFTMRAVVNAAEEILFPNRPPKKVRPKKLDLPSNSASEYFRQAFDNPF